MDGLNDDEQVQKDMAYSPGSERETQQKQDEPGAGILPGSGGPDDNGTLEVPDPDLQIPRDEGAH
jgi:hypothetical protein